jgi:hypothetical protein
MREKLRATVSPGRIRPARCASTIAATVSVKGSAREDQAMGRHPFVRQFRRRHNMPGAMLFPAAGPPSYFAGRPERSEPRRA